MAETDADKLGHQHQSAPFGGNPTSEMVTTGNAEADHRHGERRLALDGIGSGTRRRFTYRDQAALLRRRKAETTWASWADPLTEAPARTPAGPNGNDAKNEDK